MAWVILALVAALATATRDAATKSATSHLDPLAVAFGIALLPAITLGGLALLTGPGPARPGFVLALVVSGGINAVATPLIVWSLKRSDLSLVAPLTSLTPLFMIGTGAVVLGERPSVLGGVGVVVIVAGAYLLNVSDRRVSGLQPVLALAGDPGARAMVLVAFLYGVSATYDKVGVRASSPLLWAASVQAVVALVLGPIAAWRAARAKAPAEGPRAPPWALVALAGLVVSVGMVAQNVALTLTLAVYVIAVKRTSTLFGVLLGRSLFGEARTGERMLGAAVMLAGFILVSVG